MKGTFRSLRGFNYRLWSIGALVSNVGTWMQRTAQDWIVLTRLTHHNGAAVGVVIALQFGPQVALLPLTGYAADHFDRRKLLMATQIGMGVLALALGLITVFGIVHLWQVDVIALLLGCVTAFDSPARQAFVSDLVAESELSNAVALNAASFHSARMIGPAVAGLVIAGVGSGWAFLINGASYAAVMASLYFLRVEALHRKREKPRPGGLMQGFRYVWARPDILAVLIMFFLIGTFALNFPVFISTMSVQVFHVGPGRFGLLTSMMAVGSVTGALLSAQRTEPRMGFLLVGAVVMGFGYAVASVLPNYALFACALIPIGMAAQTFTTTANGWVQLGTEASMRGRVMAIFMSMALGGLAAGAPLLGWVADRFGPRYGLVVAAAAAFTASWIGWRGIRRGRWNLGGKTA